MIFGYDYSVSCLSNWHILGLCDGYFRENGDLGRLEFFWIPAFAGMPMGWSLTIAFSFILLVFSAFNVVGHSPNT